MLNIGHRGACGREPENTLISFRRAIGFGADMIELDVYVCKSGELVVMHDKTVNRATNGKGGIEELSFEQLRELDAGKGERIPLLKEVFDLTDRKAAINIELKKQNAAMPVLKLIEEYVNLKGWRFDDFLVSSFHHRCLDKIKKLNPRVNIGLLFRHCFIDCARVKERFNAYSVHLKLNAFLKKILSRRFVDKAHRNGLKVFIAVVNKKNIIERMERIGVDGVFSDFPDVVKKTLQNL